MYLNSLFSLNPTMLCAHFVWGTKSCQNRNNMSSALSSYRTDKKERNNMFFPHNKQTKFANLTSWHPKQSARTALWYLVKYLHIYIYIYIPIYVLYIYIYVYKSLNTYIYIYMCIQSFQRRLLSENYKY